MSGKNRCKKGNKAEFTNKQDNMNVNTPLSNTDENLTSLKLDLVNTKGTFSGLKDQGVAFLNMTKELEVLAKEFNKKIEILESTFDTKLKEALNLIDDLKKEIKSKDKAISELSNRVADNEMQSVSNNVLVKNIPLSSKSKQGKESMWNLREVCQGIFKDIDANGIADNYEATRLSLKKDGENMDKCPIIRIKFWTAEAKRMFFNGLGKNKNNNKNPVIRKLIAHNEYPKSMMKDVQSINKRAYEYRTKDIGSKTKILFKDAKLVLMVKKPEEEKFSTLCDS